MRGYFALVLHAHLPFVRHPEHEFFLEEEWLFEAITESYIPILVALERLVADGIPFELTLSLSPTLVSMLSDELLRRRYERHLQYLRALVDRECGRTRSDPTRQRVAQHYRRRLEIVDRTWQAKSGNIVSAFSRLQRDGYLEILTCAATHGYLPLLSTHPRAVRAQVAVAVDHYERHFHQKPRGIWLPECGYYRGLDSILANEGLRYTIADGHAIHLAQPQARFGSYSPIYCADSGVALFARDHRSSVEVWCRQQGYPGNPVYREFYRDIGFDLDLSDIGAYLRPEGVRKHTGIKYHRITGATEDKALYDAGVAKRTAVEHAANFLSNRKRQIEFASDKIGSRTLVVAPYDAELFGHWWYEGPWWLESFLRQCATEQSAFRLTQLGTYLAENPTQQMVRPAPSSWGEGGYHGVWLDESNAWIYPRLHRSADRMISMVDRWPDAQGLRRRALNQAARELLPGSGERLGFHDVHPDHRGLRAAKDRGASQSIRSYFRGCFRQ